MPQARITRIRHRLLAWYEKEARDLPWRQTRDPYAIWISEIMLQQTRVDTARRYYARFLARFPTVADLAAADLETVLKAWEGLGYYARARNLHAAAGMVVREFAGRMPSRLEDLLRLPGVGRYTAPAVASIAFGANEPVLDGNVIRVLSRVLLISGDPARVATRQRLALEARRLTEPGSASELNQAVMDLGARVCTPRKPSCEQCPVAAECAAHHRGQEAEYPTRRRKKPIPHVHVVAGVVWSRAPYAEGSRILVAQRAPDDMLGGLWEFPGGRVEESETLEQALVRELREELAIDVTVVRPLPTVDHAYSHFRMALHPFHCVHAGGSPRAIECAAWRWADLRAIEALPMSVADLRVLAAVAAEASTSA